MKHLSILGILAIFALALNLYFAIGSNFNDFKQGFEDGQKSSTYDTQADSHGFRAEIRVTPISTPSDSLNLQLPGKTVKAPYQVSEVTCLIKETPTMLITIIFSALGVIVLSVYGVYCLIRVLICITRQDIFSRRNIRWLRCSLRPVSSHFPLVFIRLEHRAGSSRASIPARLSSNGCHPDTPAMGVSHPDRITYRDFCHSRQD